MSSILEDKTLECPDSVIYHWILNGISTPLGMDLTTMNLRTTSYASAILVGTLRHVPTGPHPDNGRNQSLTSRQFDTEYWFDDLHDRYRSAGGGRSGLQHCVTLAANAVHAAYKVTYISLHAC
jgi:hypothetical protein